jgi:lysophospholipase L1-like esterase
MRTALRRNICVAFAVVALVTIAAAPLVSASKPAIGPNGQGTLLVVGDSLTFGANYFGKLGVKSQATNIWTKVVVDAKNGRKATVGAKVIADHLTDTTTAIVVALGTNDMISKSATWYPDYAIDTVMEQVGTVPVLWVNLEFSPIGRADWRSRAARFNRALKNATTRYPNLVVADWNKFFTPKGQSRFVADGVHLTVTGYKTRTSFFLAQMNVFAQQIIDATSTTSSTTEVTTSSSTSTTTTTTSSSSTTSTSTPPTTVSPTTT